MAILCINQKPTLSQLTTLTQEFSAYIKTEQLLIKSGSFQADIWGGGVDLRKKIIDCRAVANIKPNCHNRSIEILDPKIRTKFYKIVVQYFPRHATE